MKTNVRGKSVVSRVQQPTFENPVEEPKKIVKAVVEQIVGAVPSVTEQKTSQQEPPAPVVSSIEEKNKVGRLSALRSELADVAKIRRQKEQQRQQGFVKEQDQEKKETHAKNQAPAPVPSGPPRRGFVGSTVKDKGKMEKGKNVI